MTWTVADLVVLAGILAAAVIDLRTQRIPNALNGALMVAGLVIHVVAGDPWLPIVGILVAFGLHFTLWVLGVQRGGDAKLMMGVGALLGWSTMLEATLWTWALFFPVGLLVLALRGKLWNFFDTLRFTWRKALGYPVEPPAEKTYMALGLVIAVAVVVARLTDLFEFW